jgi:hypothetical protein
MMLSVPEGSVKCYTCKGIRPQADCFYKPCIADVYSDWEQHLSDSRQQWKCRECLEHHIQRQWMQKRSIHCMGNHCPCESENPHWQWTPSSQQSLLVVFQEWIKLQPILLSVSLLWTLLLGVFGFPALWTGLSSVDRNDVLASVRTEHCV